MTTIHQYINKKYPDFAKRAEIKELDLGNKELQGHLSLEGLGFDKLIYLNCSGNEITSLDTSSFPKLTSLSCAFNQLQGLELTPLTNLVYLNCSFNQITSLDIKVLHNLSFLDCSGSPLFSTESIVKSNLPYLCYESSGEMKLIIKCLEDKTERAKVWQFHRDVESQYNDRLAKGILKLVDISDLDNWVENYDTTKKGDIEYHKFLGKEAGFTELTWVSLESLATKILARGLVKQNRLANGICKEWEEKTFQESQKEMRSYLMRPMNSDSLTEEIQKAVDTEILRQGEILESSILEENEHGGVTEQVIEISPKQQ